VSLKRNAPSLLGCGSQLFSELEVAVRALDRTVAAGASGDARTDMDGMLERGHRLLLLVDALAKQVGQRAAAHS